MILLNMMLYSNCDHCNDDLMSVNTMREFIFDRDNPVMLSDDYKNTDFIIQYLCEH